MRKGLYAIVDTTSLRVRSVDPLLFARAVLVARPCVLQLRAKDMPPREGLALLRALLPECRRAGVMLVANDRPDLAALAGCDGVHVGQGDMPVEQVRRIAPGLAIGVSTHDLDQIDRAIALRPAYVAFGPVYATKTKSDHDPVVGLGALGKAAARVAGTGIPLVAIGGITLGRVGDVSVFADAAAVISGLYPDERVYPDDAMDFAEVTARACRFQAAFGRDGEEVGGERGRLFGGASV